MLAEQCVCVHGRAGCLLACLVCCVVGASWSVGVVCVLGCWLLEDMWTLNGVDATHRAAATAKMHVVCVSCKAGWYAVACTKPFMGIDALLCSSGHNTAHHRCEWIECSVGGVCCYLCPKLGSSLFCQACCCAQGAGGAQLYSSTCMKTNAGSCSCWPTSCFQKRQGQQQYYCMHAITPRSASTRHLLRQPHAKLPHATACGPWI
jgi:hypothetical protein